MQFRSIDDLLGAGLLERKPPDPLCVARWLDRSRADLDLAANVLAPIDPERAIGVAYEAGYRACAGVLILDGLRVTSQPGHHRATLEGVAAVLGASSRPLLRRLDSARRFRNDSLYGDVRPAGKDELRQALVDARAAVEELATRLGALPPPTTQDVE